MKKKIVLILVIMLIAASSLFALTQERAKNSLALSFGVVGAEFSYERIFNRYLSVMADVSYTTLIFMDEFTVAGKGRWYPFGKAYYLEMGLGFTYGKGVVGFMADTLLSVLTFGYYLTQKDFENDNFRTPGFLIQPGMGWKIDIGKPDGFVLPIGLGIDFKIAEIPDFLPFFRIGLGYSF